LRPPDAELDFDEDIETRVVRRAPSEEELSRARSSAPPPPVSEPRALPPLSPPPLPDLMRTAPPAPASGEREVTVVDRPVPAAEPLAGTGVLPPPAAPPRKAPPPPRSSQPDTERRPPAALQVPAPAASDSELSTARRAPADSDLDIIQPVSVGAPHTPRVPAAVVSEPSTARRPPPLPEAEPSTKRRFDLPLRTRTDPEQRISNLPPPVPPPRASRPTQPGTRPSRLPLPPVRPLIAITPSAALAPARHEPPRAAPPPPRTQPMASPVELARAAAPVSVGAPHTPVPPAPQPPPQRDRFHPTQTTRMPLAARPPQPAEAPQAQPGAFAAPAFPSLPPFTPPPFARPQPAALPTTDVAVPFAVPFAAPLPAPMVPVPGPLPSTIPPPVIRPMEAGEPSGWSKAAAMLGALSLVITVGLGAFMLWPRTGALRVELSGDAGTIGRLEIFVDGHKRCDTAPCVVTDLAPGARNVQIALADGPPVTVSEQVVAGRQTTVVVPVPGSTLATIKATGGQAGVKVFVDGQDHGPLPAQLKDIAPGQRRITFDGGDRYEKAEQTVDVAAGQVLDLGQVVLPVKRGLVTVHLETRGATVMLVAADRKSQKLLPGPWPMTLDVHASEGWRLVASKPGHREMVEELSFADGNAERRIDVDLARLDPAGRDAAVARPTVPRPAAPTPPTPAPAAQPGSDASSQEVAPTGTGTLNANSLPVSKVLVDGRALGSTPQMGISLPAGTHTVTFVHPELGKKSVTIQVRPGEKAVAAVRFGPKEEAK
jgi:serine/threonine-protein kinase